MKSIRVTYMDQTISVNCPDKIATQLRRLGDVKRGRFAYITDHVSGQPGVGGCIRPAVSNILFNANPNYGNYLLNKQTALRRLPAAFPATADLAKIEWGGKQALAKLAAFNLTTEAIEALYNAAKDELLDSVANSLANDKSDGFRMSAYTCYAFRKGWRLHLETEDVILDGKKAKRPCISLENGRMTVGSIMLPFFAVRREYTVYGEWKPVKSGPMRVMKDVIEEACGLPDWKSFSLTNENFGTISMNAKEFYGAMPDKATKHYDDIIAAICGLGSTLPMNALAQDAANSVGLPEVEDEEDEEVTQTHQR